MWYETNTLVLYICIYVYKGWKKFKELWKKDLGILFPQHQFSAKTQQTKTNQAYFKLFSFLLGNLLYGWGLLTWSQNNLFNTLVNSLFKIIFIFSLVKLPSFFSISSTSYTMNWQKEDTVNILGRKTFHYPMCYVLRWIRSTAVI